MNERRWPRVGLSFTALLLAVGGTTLVATLPSIRWEGSARGQWLLELLAAGISFEVAAFAISRFDLERRRLPLFIGLGFLAMVIADLVAAALSQGRYPVPLIGQSDGLAGVWTSGWLGMAVFLWVGLVAQRWCAVADSARSELVPAVVAGGALAFALTQGLVMARLPWGRLLDGMALVGLAGAFVVFFRLYWHSGGSMLASLVLALAIALSAVVAMLRSTATYDGEFMLALALKVASGLPPLVGLFVESVQLFRAQKRLSGELQIARDSLEVKVAERTHALETRAKELEAFAYTVSHDLKAPLRGVQTYASLLATDYADKLDADGRRYAASLQKAAGNMRTLIDDLLEYSRLEHRHAEFSPVNLADLVESVIDERRPLIEQLHAEVKTDIAVPAVTADRAMLRLALTNLIDNALKYSSRSKPPRVEITGCAVPAGTTVTVRDNGVGFDRQYREKIFEVFERLHGQEDFDGTGIGLSIVKRAIEKHGGRVWADAEPGAGATFQFTLPAS